MSDKPLWTNEMIYKWSNAAKETVLHNNRIRDMISSAQAEGLAETMRDEYEAKLATLRAQLAECKRVAGALSRSGEDIVKWREEVEADSE